MPQEIISRSIAATTDQRARLSNGQINRNIAVLDDWSVIRLGMLISFAGAATLNGSPKLTFGMNSGRTIGYAEATTPKFIGVILSATSWTFNAGAVPYYTMSEPRISQKTLAVVTNTAFSLSGSPGVSSSPTLARSALVIQITKGSPNYTLDCVRPNVATGAATDCTPAELLAMMESGTMADVASIVAGYTQIGPTAVAFTEGATLLDAISIYWDKTAVPCEVSEVRFRKIS